VVYDVLGRKTGEYNNVNAKDFELLNFTKTNSALIVRITLENNAKITKKVVF
jgi:hypothetical protein